MYNNEKGTVETIDRAIKESNNLSIEYYVAVLEFARHERLIHLIVTFFVGILALITLFMSLVTTNLYTLILFVLLLILEVFYLWHYYLLENKTQELEQLYLRHIRNTHK